MGTAEPSRKRARPDQRLKLKTVLTPERDKVMQAIRSRGNRGMWLQDIKKETGIPPNMITKQINLLKGAKMVKEVKDIRYKSRKVYMAAEFEPSEEMTGGAWFSGGSLNTQAINNVKKRCKQQIIMLKAVTADMIWQGMKKSDANFKYTMQQIGDILESLVLDKEIEEVESTGKGDFASVPTGKICYKTVQMNNGTHISGFASIPCAVCPRLRDCTPDGVISPSNCPYFKNWIGGDW